MLHIISLSFYSLYFTSLNNHTVLFLHKEGDRKDGTPPKLVGIFGSLDKSTISVDPTYDLQSYWSNKEKLF